jgi:hypothetical protein
LASEPIVEKIIYLVWRDPKVDIETFGKTLRGDFAAQLRSIPCVRSLQVNVADAAVAAGAGIKQTNSNPSLETVVQVWVDSAIAHLRAPVDATIAAHTARFAAYLVTESQPLRNLRHPPKIGERTDGFAQIALLRKPQQQPYAEWIDVWHNSHTRVAIDTQSTFEYIQNVVIRPLTADAPALDAMVEEGFPIGALNDPYLFFDAVGNEEKFQSNLKIMMDSVHRFIDMTRIDVAPTSQYKLI